MLTFLMFLIGAGTVVGAYLALTYVPERLAKRQIDKRLAEVSAPFGLETADGSVIKREDEGPLPGVARLLSRFDAGAWFPRLVEQSGTNLTAGTAATLSLACAAVFGVATYLVMPRGWLAAVAAGVGALLPPLFLMQRRRARMKKFEEQFPEALDLLARALRAGHAFQSTLGMIGEELPEPVGPEFKKTFEQQNFGLPLRESLLQLSERIPILDVRFFATAVLIQRETGGNLAEILDNLGHVVRERFKIRRQVRVHTAHGRFTAVVLLLLPAALGLALTFLNPDHMRLLFTEPVGRMMLATAAVMQTIGLVWIRQVIKIEV